MTALDRLEKCVLTTEQIRQVDRIAIDQYQMNSLVLMENAALNCVRWLRRKYDERQARPRTMILCGRGNNGGDGLVIARHLQTLGWPVELLLLGPPEKLSEDNLANWRILAASLDSQAVNASIVVNYEPDQRQRILRADLILDAMLGTGVRGAPRPPFAEWIEAANTSEATRVAIDIPTGVCAESGQRAEPYFHADHTLSFVALKPAMSQADAQEIFGEIDILPIGLPLRLVEEVCSWANSGG